MIAYVTRVRDGRKQVLVFDHRDHPDAGTQVPAGRLDEGESFEQGLVRELEEESGLTGLRVVRELELPDGLVHGRGHDNRAFELLGDDGVPETFEHVVAGTGDDAGLVFCYRWEPVREGLLLWNAPDPVLSSLLHPHEPREIMDACRSTGSESPTARSSR